MSDFHSISDSAGPVGNVSMKEKALKTIKELEYEINSANPNEAIYSDLEVWLTHTSFKGKWYYEACNNRSCKKSTEAFSKCMNCGHYNDNTIKKIIMPIEISDITGSLWTTAFDEFAQEIFKGIAIETLFELDEAALKEEAERRMYQQFRLRLSTKKEYEGNVKHSIQGRTTEVTVEKALTSNVERIKKILFE